VGPDSLGGFASQLICSLVAWGAGVSFDPDQKQQEVTIFLLEHTILVDMLQ
jgi:hypothetical protein